MAKKPTYQELEVRIKKLEKRLDKRFQENKQLSRDIEENTHLFKEIAQHMGEGVSLCRASDGIIIYTNPRFDRMFGYDPGELTGKHISIINAPRKRTPEEIATCAIETIIEKGIMAGEILNVKKDGTQFYCHASGSQFDHPRHGPVILSVNADIDDLKRTEKALKKANEKQQQEHHQRKLLSKRLVNLLEKDRRQIAMELHDHIGQILTSLKMNLEIIHEQLKPSDIELESQIYAAEKKAIKVLKDIKRVSRGLRPSMIDILGVVSSLRDLFNEFERETKIKVRFFVRNVPKRFDPEKELTVYRVAQEALNNIIRHANAKNVYVNMVKKDEVLSLSVEDDGVGFDAEKVMKTTSLKGPLGLLHMQERAIQLAGEFTLESRIGKGTHISIEIPI